MFDKFLKVVGAIVVAKTAKDIIEKRIEKKAQEMAFKALKEMRENGEL